MSNRDILIALSYIYNGDWDKIYDVIKKKDDDFDIASNYKFKPHKYQILTILDKEYPDYLRNVFKPPFVLFYYGDISLINNIEHKLAVVGTRDCTPYGVSITEELVSGLSNEYVIVSGGASGIDTIAHRAALKSKKKTICVLGSGINNYYPKDNALLFETIKRKGLLISEYPDKVFPTTLTYPYRNRLIAGFSKAVLMSEAPYKSGAHITVSYALADNKEIFVPPFKIGEETGMLNNKLIQQGACLVTSAEELEFFLK